MKVDLSLKVRSLLNSSAKGNGLLYYFFKVVMLRICGNGLDDRAVELCAQLVNVYLRSFLCVDIALVQCDYNRDPQFQKLCRKEQ